MRVKLSELPPQLRAAVEAKLAEEEKRSRIAQDAAQVSEGPKTRVTPSERKNDGALRKRSAPNKTEAEYNRLYLHGLGLYEAITLRLPGGSRYTPDWVLIGDDGMVELHEVKGSYRFGSQGRALTAWREAAAAFRCFKFVWAKREKNGKWRIERLNWHENDHGIRGAEHGMQGGMGRGGVAGPLWG